MEATVEAGAAVKQTGVRAWRQRRMIPQLTPCTRRSERRLVAHTNRAMPMFGGREGAEYRGAGGAAGVNHSSKNAARQCAERRAVAWRGAEVLFYVPQVRDARAVLR